MSALSHLPLYMMFGFHCSVPYLKFFLRCMWISAYSAILFQVWRVILGEWQAAVSNVKGKLASASGLPWWHMLLHLNCAAYTYIKSVLDMGQAALAAAG